MPTHRNAGTLPVVNSPVQFKGGADDFVCLGRPKACPTVARVTRETLRAVVLLPVLAWLASAQAGLDPAKVREIEKAVSAEMARQNIPAVSVAIAVGSKVRWANGFGIADLENFVPAKAATVYRLGSIAKPFTAVAVMQLVEKGKLDLNAPVQKYVPKFPTKQWPLTVRHLLIHQGGIRHYRDQSEINSTRHYTDLLEPLKIFWNDSLLFEPGTAYHYSTYGYSLLGAVVEAASGMRFTEYLRARIFEPAGMRQTQPDDVYAIIPNRARGYRPVLGGGFENCALADTSNKIPGGGLCGTAEDLVEFAIHLNAGTLLDKETVEQMFTRQRTRTGRLTPYGLGWQITEGDRRWIGHGGAQQGTRTLLLMLPKEGFVVALLCNLEGANLEPLAPRIAGIVLP